LKSQFLAFAEQKNHKQARDKATVFLCQRLSVAVAYPCLHVQAHKSALMGMVGASGSCATWSVQGSIKIWTARDFLDTMRRHGLIRTLVSGSENEKMRRCSTRDSAVG